MSVPSGENTGAHKREESVSNVVLARFASERSIKVFRNRECRNATLPLRATLGEEWGPVPVVNCTGVFPPSGCHQRLEAPPRVEEWITPRPFGSKTGASLTTPGTSFVRRVGSPPWAGTIQISRLIPPRLRCTVKSRPSGDHDWPPTNG